MRGRRLRGFLRRSLPVLGLALAGCAGVGPDYRRPEVVLPAAYPQAAASGAEAPEAAVAAQWWTLYGDTELNRLVEAALVRNTDIAQAVARVEEADAAVREVGSALLPSVDLGASASRSRSSGSSTQARTPGGIVGNNLRLALSTAFEIDFWGKLRRATEAARAQLLATAESRDTVRLTVASLSAQAWFALRSLDEQIVVTRATLETRDEGVRLLDLRLRAGSSSRLDLEQARSLRAETAVQLRELERQRAVAQSQLALLTVQPGLAIAASTLPQLPPPPVPPLGLPSALLERRPDVRSAEAQLVSANAEIGVARAAMFPTLSLTSTLGAESRELSRLVDGPARIWSLGFGLSLPLFDSGRSGARTDQAIARQQAAVAAYQGAVGTAFKEVADALADLQAATASQADLEQREQAAGSALGLSKNRYDAGYSAYLELLDAQRTAAAARLDVVRNRQSQLNASVSLFQALGGGWQRAATP